MAVNDRLLQGKLADRPQEEKLPVEDLLRAIAEALIEEEKELNHEST